MIIFITTQLEYISTPSLSAELVINLDGRGWLLATNLLVLTFKSSQLFVNLCVAEFNELAIFNSLEE